MTKGIDKYSIDSTDYTVGQDNVQKWGFDVHNPVLVSVLVSLHYFLSRRWCLMHILQKQRWMALS